MKKQLFSIGIFAIAIFTYVASSSPKEAQAPAQAITFDYATTSSEKPGSAGMLIALVNPKYAESFDIRGSALFDRFRKSLAADVEELLVAKGFTLKGPYETQDEMIFDDKKGSDIMILIEVSPDFTNAQGKWTEQFRISSTTPASYKYAGTCSLVGKINLTGIEPLTGEKIWVKSVLIPPVDNIVLQTQKAYTTNTWSNLLYEDPGISNPIGVALQSSYKGILDKMATTFNPEELRSLKPQIKELKAKKGY